MTFSEFVTQETGYHWSDYSDLLERKGYGNGKIDENPT